MSDRDEILNAIAKEYQIPRRYLEGDTGEKTPDQEAALTRYMKRLKAREPVFSIVMGGLTADTLQTVIGRVMEDAAGCRYIVARCISGPIDGYWTFSCRSVRWYDHLRWWLMRKLQWI